jgi:hypothetical protein
MRDHYLDFEELRPTGDVRRRAERHELTWKGMLLHAQRELDSSPATE